MDEMPILFPKFLGRARYRQLSLWTMGRVLLASGDWRDAPTMDELVELLFSEDLLCFVRSLLDLPEGWLETALAHGDCYCTPDGEPRALRIRGPRRMTRWIVQASSWGARQPTLELLQELTQVMQLAKSGTHGTPGALGLAILRRSYKEEYGADWQLHRHRRPPESTCEWLRETSTGARNDFDPAFAQMQFPVLKELDLKNAYGAALARGVPTGPCIKFWGEPDGDYASYYAKAVVSIVDTLSYGLFPVRKPGEETVYPTAAGSYAVCLWKEEVDFLRSKGLTVTIEAGEGWDELTQDLAPFVRLCEWLRDSAPPDLQKYFKLALVAAIGRLGMASESYLLSDQETDVRVSFDGRAYDLFVEKLIQSRPETMPHWMYHVLMQIRLALTIEADRWKQQEMLVGTNTDGAYLKPEADTSDYVPVALKAGQPSGSWILTEHYDVRLPARRHFVSEDKVTLPGIPEESRPAYLARLEEDDVPY